MFIQAAQNSKELFYVLNVNISNEKWRIYKMVNWLDKEV
jgi:hypothetical protein